MPPILHSTESRPSSPIRDSGALTAADHLEPALMTAGWYAELYRLSPAKFDSAPSADSLDPNTYSPLQKEAW
jgi:hypothetical protein